MNKHQRRLFYQTPAWRSMSYQIRKRDSFLCTSCRPRTVPARLVHHVRPLSKNGPALDPRNLTSLCAECHSSVHGVVVDEERKAWQSYIRELLNQF